MRHEVLGGGVHLLVAPYGVAHADRVQFQLKKPPLTSCASMHQTFTRKWAQAAMDLVSRHGGACAGALCVRSRKFRVLGLGLKGSEELREFGAWGRVEGFA